MKKPVAKSASMSYLERLNKENTMNIELFGISSCDKVKAARKWLSDQKIDFQWVDIRQSPIKEDGWQNWLGQVNLDRLLNKRSTTWKGLDTNTQQSLTPNNAAKLFESHPTLMKRPLLQIDQKIIAIGFKPENYQGIFNSLMSNPTKDKK